jgi:hypothetical protein
MHRLAFSSDELPAGLNDQARMRLWRDIYTARYGEFDFRHVGDAPFWMRSEFAAVGDIAIAQASGTPFVATRTAQSTAADEHDDFAIGLNRANSLSLMLQRGREVICATGQAMFWSYGEVSESRAERWIGLVIPRARLRELIADPEDLIARPIDPNTPALRHLGRYLDFLFASQELDDELFSGRVARRDAGRPHRPDFRCGTRRGGTGARGWAARGACA